MPLVISPVEYARQQMVDQQVRAWAIPEPEVLAVMTSVRREMFVPAHLRQVAFADAAVPLAHQQVMLSPQHDGRILQALAVQPTDHVLDVGTGSGFLAACLGRLGRHVQSIEIYPDLAAQAQANLLAAVINNVVVETGDATRLADENRYDAIAVTGSLPMYDERFQRALKVGGRLFAIVGTHPVMEAIKITRLAPDQFAREVLFETSAPPLINAARPSAFVF